MNKKILPILIAVGTLVLGGCGGGESSSDEGPAQLEALAISNKTALQATWKTGESSRNLEFSSTPEINVTEELNSGNLVVSSSDTAIANVVGRVVMPVAVGTATISVAYLEHMWDTVDVTISEPVDTDINVAEALVIAGALAVGATSELTYQVTGIVAAVTTPYSSQYGNISFTIGDTATDANLLTVYRCAVTQVESAEILANATVVVEGKLQNFNGSLQLVAGTLISVEPGDPVDPVDPVGVLLATYDLSDQVRTAYVDGVNTKYTEGLFAPFLQGQIVSGGTEKLVSSSGETNVYTAAQSSATTGPQFNGIKFGSSSAGGSVTLAFEAGTNVNKVVVGCAGWATPNTDTLTIGGVTKTPTQGSVTATVEVLEFTFADTDSVTIVTNKRIIFSYIAVYSVAA